MRFSLRFLGLILTLCAVVCAVWRFEVARYWAQQAALERLERFTREVELRPAGRAWSRYVAGWLGVQETLRDVVMLDFRSSRTLRDEDLAALAKLPRIERLYLANTPITDEGLRHVGSLRHLRRLALQGTKITDDGLAHLADLPGLEALDVQSTRTTERSLTHLRRHTELQLLRFDTWNPLSENAVRSLAAFPKLSLNGLHCFGVSSPSLAEVLSRPVLAKSLTSLHLLSCHIDDDALLALDKVQDLYFLTLSDCRLPPQATCRLFLPRPHLTHIALHDTSLSFGDILECAQQEDSWLAGRPATVSIRSNRELSIKFAIRQSRSTPAKPTDPLDAATIFGNRQATLFVSQSRPDDRTSPSHLPAETLRRFGQRVPISAVQFRGCPCPDEWFEFLEEYKHLQSVTVLNCPNFGGRGLAAVAELPQLAKLTLERTSVTHDQLRAAFRNRPDVRIWSDRTPL